MIYDTDFSHLPEVEFVSRDTGTVERDMIKLCEHITKRTLHPGDPVRLFITTLAAMYAQRNVIIDDTGKQNLLRYARKGMLDHIGAMLDVRRLGATHAETELRFSIAAPVAFPVRIPAGTRATADSTLYFETAGIAVLAAGESFVDVPARAMAAGAAGNGLVPGQISHLCDPLDVVVSVANTETSAGGAETESDDSFRDRIRQAPEKFTTAGSEGAYIYWARTAHPSVADVSPDSPVPGAAHLYILLNDGVIPDEDGPEIKAVAETVSAETVRPLTDRTKVFPAVGVDMDYAFTYYLNRRQAAFADIIAENVKKACADFTAWQTARIGRDFNPDELIRACRAAGVKRIKPVLIRSGAEEPLQFRALSRKEVARIPPRTDRIRFGGVEDN